MQQKIQELTEKVYQEGVQKGEKKAAEIVSDAQARAEKIVADAKAEAASVAAAAQKQAQDLRANIESEIRLSAQQAINAVKQQIIDVVLAKSTDAKVAGALTDAAFIKELIKTAVGAWKGGNADSASLAVLLPAEKQAELEKAFKAGVHDILGAKVDIRYGRQIKAGFQIMPAAGGYKISLTDEDFQQFFKEFLRPRAKEFLFGK